MSKANQKDEELDAVISELVRRYGTQERGQSGLNKGCCTSPLKGAIVARSYGELIKLVNVCRAAFVLVTTTYCPYCMMFKPVFSKVAHEFRGRAAFIEVNADYVPEVVMTFEVYSSPTLITLIDGHVVDSFLGYVPYEQFKSYVENVLDHVNCLEANG